MPAGQRPDKSDRRFWNRLYRQKPDGTFTDVTEKAGLTGMPQNRYGMGAAVGDYDNDGFADLYVTGYGGNTLYRNNGDGTLPRRHREGRRRRLRLERERRVLRRGQRRRARPLRHALRGVDVREERLLRGEEARLPCLLPPRQLRGRPRTSSIATTATGRSRTSPRRPASPPPGARGSGSPSPTTTTTASWTSTWPTTPCSPSCTTTTGTAPSPRSACSWASGSTRTARPSPGMGVDFADYDNDGRPDLVVTDLSNERYRLFRQGGDGSFQDATHSSGRGRRHPPLLGLEHALLRLRQRRLEGHLRRPGTRDGHHREDRSQPAIPAAAAAAAQRVRAFRESGSRRGLPEETGPAAAPPSATWTTTATSTSWSATWASGPSCSGTTAGIGSTGSGSEPWEPHRTATASGAG